MENASKALIIAGAILLAILLISLGIMIYNQAQSATDGSGMSDAEISTFNSKFTKYEGDKKGPVVKTLINEIDVNNAREGTDGENLIEYEDGSIRSTAGIDNNKTYHVVFGKSTETGRINSCTITAK